MKYERYPDELAHYGVKGMKWGVRKQKKTNKNIRAKKKSNDDLINQYNYLKKKYKHSYSLEIDDIQDEIRNSEDFIRWRDKKVNYDIKKAGLENDEHLPALKRHIEEYYEFDGFDKYIKQYFK